MRLQDEQDTSVDLEDLAWALQVQNGITEAAFAVTALLKDMAMVPQETVAVHDRFGRLPRKCFEQQGSIAMMPLAFEFLGLSQLRFVLRRPGVDRNPDPASPQEESHAE
jgi:hypothetical protein